MHIIYTEHAKERLKKRKITQEEIELALKYPDITIKEGEKYIVRKNIGRANIEVVYEKDRYIKVVTIYYI